MRTMIHLANANYDKKGGDCQKSRLLVKVLNWIIIKNHKNDNDNDDDDDDNDDDDYYDDDDDDRCAYG